MHEIVGLGPTAYLRIVESAEAFAIGVVVEPDARVLGLPSKLAVRI